MNKITKVMIISMVTNCLLSILKIIVGFIGKSSALIADGIHSFSDLSTDVVALTGNYISNKPADSKHPYGHGKIEYVTSIIISMVILGLGFGIIYNSISNEVVIPSVIVIVVSIITIVVKLLLSKYIIKKGEEYQNNILIASGYESRTDVISSIVVLVSAIFMQFTDIWNGFLYADLCASVIVGILIVKIGFDILRENLSIILGEQETDLEYLKSLKRIILKNKNIHHVDEMTILKYGSYYKFIAEVSIDSHITILEAHKYIHEVENALKDYDKRIKYVTIHVNPYQRMEYTLKKVSSRDQKVLKDMLERVILEKNNVSKTEKKEIEAYVLNVLEEHVEDYNMIWCCNKKIGCIGYYKVDKDTYLLDTIYIIPEYQGLKIGSDILKNLLQKVKKEKKKIILWVYKDNYSALKLYEKFGFQVKEETKTRYRMEFI